MSNDINIKKALCLFGVRNKRGDFYTRVIMNSQEARGKRADFIIWLRQPLKSEFSVVFPAILGSSIRLEFNAYDNSKHPIQTVKDAWDYLHKYGDDIYNPEGYFEWLESQSDEDTIAEARRIYRLEKAEQ